MILFVSIYPLLLPVPGLGSLIRQMECSLNDMFGPIKKLRYRSLEYLQIHNVSKEQYTILNTELIFVSCIPHTVAWR